MQRALDELDLEFAEQDARKAAEAEAARRVAMEAEGATPVVEEAAAVRKAIEGPEITVEEG
jgi:hypothetical protein